MAKSRSYQHIFKEIPTDSIEDFSSEFGLTQFINSHSETEKQEEMKRQLMVEITRLIHTKLTPKQAEIITLRLQGLTEQEIADLNGVTQPAIHKAMYGNDVKVHGEIRRYGGCIKMLRKWASRDDIICSIISELRKPATQNPL